MMDCNDFWSDSGADWDIAVPARSKRLLDRKGFDKHIALIEVGRTVCFGGKGGGDAPAPDPNIGVAAVKNAQTGEQWLNFAKEQFAVGNERQKQTDALTTKVINQQLDTQDQTNQWAQEDRARTKNVFQPMQDEFIAEAKNYASPERQAQMAAEATADVQKASDTQRQINTRSMAAMGINPASGRFAGVTRATDLNTSIAGAGAANSARQSVRDKGLALKADAINMGNGLASSTASAYGIGLNAGNSAVGNRGAANASFYQNQAGMNQGFGGAMQGYANEGNILNNLYGNQLNAWAANNQANATSASGLGSLIGTVGSLGLGAYKAGLFSSKKLKENKRPAEGGLDAVNAMPVEQWKYKDGVADGGEHIGPYAEDFQAATGKGDGTTIPIVDAIGVTMKAVQELDQKVEKLAKRKG